VFHPELRQTGWPLLTSVSPIKLPTVQCVTHTKLGVLRVCDLRVGSSSRLEPPLCALLNRRVSHLWDNYRHSTVVYSGWQSDNPLTSGGRRQRSQLSGNLRDRQRERGLSVPPRRYYGCADCVCGGRCVVKAWGWGRSSSPAGCYGSWLRHSVTPYRGWPRHRCQWLHRRGASATPVRRRGQRVIFKNVYSSLKETLCGDSRYGASPAIWWRWWCSTHRRRTSYNS